MKGRVLALLFLAFIISPLAAQNEALSGGRVLVVFEENNSNIDPWIDIFKEELIALRKDADFAEASEIQAKDLASYGEIIVFGSYMAFGMKEPVRDWLKKKGDLSGKKVYLFVTAGSSNPKKYSNQLVKLLKGKKAEVLDAVTCATKSMEDDDKAREARAFLSGLGR